MENIFLFAAFTVIWVCILVYLVMLMNRQKKLQRELQSLKEALEKKENKH